MTQLHAQRVAMLTENTVLTENAGTTA
jgi:hypothetical protein